MTRDQLFLCATLSKLQLTESDVETLHGPMSAAFTVFTTIHLVDTQGVRPMVHPLDIELAWRQDTVEPRKEHAVFNWKQVAPDFEDGYFKVPKIID